jgi:hypothetical protein
MTYDLEDGLIDKYVFVQSECKDTRIENNKQHG